MKRWGVIAIAVFSMVVFSLLGIWRGHAFASDKTPAQLEAEYDRESNPKKRVKLAVELSDERLKQVRSAYEAEDSGKTAESVENYLSAVNRLEKAVRETSGSGASKDAEIHLRQQAHALENLKMSISFSERPPVEKAATRITKLHEEILYGIMNPHKESAKR